MPTAYIVQTHPVSMSWDRKKEKENAVPSCVSVFFHSSIPLHFSILGSNSNRSMCVAVRIVYKSRSRLASRAMCTYSLSQSMYTVVDTYISAGFRDVSGGSLRGL